MKFTLLSLFPTMLESYFGTSIAARAVEKGIIEYELVDIRDFATDRHRTADDAPYGGGFGMVMKPEPVGAALVAAGAQANARPDSGRFQTSQSKPRVVYLTPAGTRFTQAAASDLATASHLILLCGRYEGIDQRVIDRYVDDELSIGDYVLSSGEVAALVVIDTIYRLIDGVITPGSLAEESHLDGLLEYPHYTRPEVYEGERVPEVLLSGHHGRIRQWRRRESIRRTLSRRPDLLEQAQLSADEWKYVKSLTGGQNGFGKGD